MLSKNPYPYPDVPAIFFNRSLSLQIFAISPELFQFDRQGHDTEIDDVSNPLRTEILARNAVVHPVIQ